MEVEAWSRGLKSPLGKIKEAKSRTSVLKVWSSMVSTGDRAVNAKNGTGNTIGISRQQKDRLDFSPHSMLRALAVGPGSATGLLQVSQPRWVGTVEKAHSWDSGTQRQIRLYSVTTIHSG